MSLSDHSTNQPENSNNSSKKAQKVGLGPLPCLNRNNSNEPLILSSQHKKSSFILLHSVEEMAHKYDVDYIGFVTLTFPIHITDPNEAQRYYNSFRTGFLCGRYECIVRVIERQKSGRIHYHLIVICSHNIRRGYDHSDNKTANKHLKAEQMILRKTALKYGFGRTEIKPVRSNAEALGKYVGKYIGKTLECRDKRDKGVRLISYSGNARAGSTRFTFVCENSRKWRLGVSRLVDIMKIKYNTNNIRYENIQFYLGKKWAWNHRDYITTISNKNTIGVEYSSNVGSVIKRKEQTLNVGDVTWCDYYINYSQGKFRVVKDKYWKKVTSNYTDAKEYILENIVREGKYCLIGKRYRVTQ